MEFLNKNVLELVGFGNGINCKRKHCWEESNNYNMVIRGP